MRLKPVTLNKMLFINKWWGRSSNIKNAVMVADGIGYTHTHTHTNTPIAFLLVYSTNIKKKIKCIFKVLGLIKISSDIK